MALKRSRVVSDELERQLGKLEEERLSYLEHHKRNDNVRSHQMFTNGQSQPDRRWQRAEWILTRPITFWVQFGLNNPDHIKHLLMMAVQDGLSIYTTLMLLRNDKNCDEARRQDVENSFMWCKAYRDYGFSTVILAQYVINKTFGEVIRFHERFLDDEKCEHSILHPEDEDWTSMLCADYKSALDDCYLPDKRTSGDPALSKPVFVSSLDNDTQEIVEAVVDTQIAATSTDIPSNSSRKKKATVWGLINK